MSTSGVTTNQLSRNEIITMALRKLNVIADGQTPSSDNYSNGAAALNVLIGEFRALGMQVWARQEYTFTPTLGVATYNIGTGQTLNTPYPLHLLQAFRTASSSSKIPLEIVSKFNFNMYPAGSSGLPVQVSYQPKVNYGVLQMWPTPDSGAVSTSTITLVYTRPIEYFSTSIDTADFPEEWIGALVYNLAVRLAPEWGIPLPDREMLRKEAKEYLDNAMGHDREDGSLFFQPDRR